MAKYRLTGEKHFVRNGNELTSLQKGQVVELTDEQARNWRDKFEPVAEAPKAEK